MYNSLYLELRSARRKAGLTQGDVAHLLGRHQQLVSDFECGQRLPSVPQLCTLALIYQRPLESLLVEFLAQSRADVSARLSTLPAATPRLATFNRQHALEQLAQRLADEAPTDGA